MSMTMRRVHVTFLLAIGLFVCASAYNEKSIHSSGSYRPSVEPSSAPARLSLPAPRPVDPVHVKSDQRQGQASARLQAPSYQVQLQPVSFVVSHDKQQARFQQQPSYEHRVPQPVFHQPFIQAAPAKSIQFHSPTYETSAQRVEISAPAPQPAYQPALLRPIYQTTAFTSSSAGYGEGEREEKEEKGHRNGNDGAGDDDDDDEERDRPSDDDERRTSNDDDDRRPAALEAFVQQQPVAAMTYPAFDGYKAQQQAYQVVAFQAPRPAQLSYPHVSLEATKPSGAEASEGAEAEEESYPDDLSAIPGEPGKDYPNLSRLPEIYFSCDDKLPGYYADVDYKCQVWHFCNDGRRQSFLCPNGTIYSQEKFVCEWWFNVDCSSSSSYFGLNEELYKVPVKVEAPSAQPQYIYEQPQQQPHYTVTLPAASFVQQQPSSPPAPAPVKSHHKVFKQQQQQQRFQQVVQHRPAFQPQQHNIKSSQQQQQQTSYY